MALNDWLVAAGLACNLILAAFTYGRMTEAVSELRRRVRDIETWRERYLESERQRLRGSTYDAHSS